MSKAEIGKKVPEFELPATSNTTVSMKSLKGRNAVIYFYPKDSTPGCTTEGQDFRDRIAEFDKANTAILGRVPGRLEIPREFQVQTGVPL